VGERERRIVVGVDDSAGGRAALAYALREAGVRGARVDAVVAVDVPEYWAAIYGAPVPTAASIEQVRRRGVERVREVLAEVRVAEAADLQGTPQVDVRAVGGNPAGALLDAAAGADLLVVGASRHGRLTGMVLGSVALQCVLHAPCPTTVVHPVEVAAAQPVG
jgi:nucleotide-binding universal stress UspA family protein